jgi:DNA helicase-2/ATP-dependent DNA helicase PcrA
MQEVQKSLEKLKQNLRSGQKMLADWNGGEMAISAVPGAGKSHCLAIGATLAIAANKLNPTKKLLIVTYTRSAAISIKTKINQILKENLQGKLGPQAIGGFAVHTLHGLALNIASRYQELSEINLENSTVIIPSPSNKIIRDTVEKWINNNQNSYQKLVKGLKLEQEKTENLHRQLVLRTDILPNLAYTVIKEAKSSGLSPQRVRKLGKNFHDEYNILDISAGLYQEYQNLLKERNYLDYEDMILAALNVLKNPQILKIFQEEYFAVFEDEAQDSSPLQGKLIKLLAANSDNNFETNLVRVGDPNQAINSTFTPADQVYFDDFCNKCEGKNSLSTMDQAGRSNKIIMEAANFLVTWVNEQNKPEKTFRKQFIRAVDDDDPQLNANPEPEGRGVEIYFPDDIYETVNLIGSRVKKLLKNNGDRTVAILVKENRQGSFLAEKLAYLQEENQIIVYEVGEMERQTKIPEEMLNLLKFIDRPHSNNNLKLALEVLENRQLLRKSDLSAIIYPEEFLYPNPLNSSKQSKIEKARLCCSKLLKARLELPPNDLIPFLGMTLGYEGGELATMEKLSERINQQTINNNSLKRIIELLEEIVITKRFDAVEEENENKYTKPNQLTIITMHKSKGLDWDYVFIPFLQKNMLPKTTFVSSNQNFLGNFTLDEVARTLIRNYIHQTLSVKNNINQISSCDDAWREAENLKIQEEYRLLYVAMTRAKRLLWMSSAKKAPFNWSLFDWEQNDNLEEQQPSPFLEILYRKLT